MKVSWSDGWYLASVRSIPEEATFEKTLQGVIATTKATIVRYVGAPVDLASDLCLRVELDQQATRKFAELGE